MILPFIYWGTCEVISVASFASAVPVSTKYSLTPEYSPRLKGKYTNFPADTGGVLEVDSNCVPTSTATLEGVNAHSLLL